MDVAGQRGVTSVLARANGGAALYLSTGGAITIGSGRPESLRNAAIIMIDEAAKQTTQLKTATKYGYPKKGNVSFFVRTPESTLTATVPESELRGGNHPLTPLYVAGQTVITELRRFTMWK